MMIQSNVKKIMRALVKLQLVKNHVDERSSKQNGDSAKWQTDDQQSWRNCDWSKIKLMKWKVGKVMIW